MPSRAMNGVEMVVMRPNDGPAVNVSAYTDELLVAFRISALKPRICSEELAPNSFTLVALRRIFGLWAE